ncbi:phosphoglucosamine mutase, partial [Francisella tularensis subsp. holarctica]|nr:phosphoglucosamine mutase [Francisella tularensis subsp. holarctica]
QFKIGSYKILANAIEEYIERINSRFSKFVKNKVTVVVDCSHGAAYLTFEGFLDNFGFHYVSIAFNTAGFNINVGCGA